MFSFGFIRDYFLNRSIRNSAQELVHTVADLIEINNQQESSLVDFSVLFTKSVLSNKKLTIEDIDCFIDWLYTSGLVIPSLDRYQQLGMNIVITRKIYIPYSVQNLFSDWKALKDRALNSGILLTVNKSAPSLELWNTELSSFLPGLFCKDDLPSYCDIVLERIVQIAEESFDDRANLPDYIARLANIEFQSESDYLDDLDTQLELLLRKHAYSLKIVSDDPPTDLRSKIKRIANQADRFHLVQDWRAQHLLSEEMQWMKSLIYKK